MNLSEEKQLSQSESLSDLPSSLREKISQEDFKDIEFDNKNLNLSPQFISEDKIQRLIESKYGEQFKNLECVQEVDSKLERSSINELSQQHSGTQKNQQLSKTSLNSVDFQKSKQQNVSKMSSS